MITWLILSYFLFECITPVASWLLIAMWTRYLDIWTVRVRKGYLTLFVLSQFRRYRESLVVLLERLDLGKYLQRVTPFGTLRHGAPFRCRSHIRCRLCLTPRISRQVTLFATSRVSSWRRAQGGARPAWYAPLTAGTVGKSNRFKNFVVRNEGTEY